MPKTPEFNFSTNSSKESFETLPGIAKKKLIEVAMEEEETLRRLVESGKASDYADASRIHEASIGKRDKKLEVTGKEAAYVIQELYEAKVELYRSGELFKNAAEFRERHKDDIVPKLNWEKYKEFLHVEISQGHDGKFYTRINEHDFGPPIYFLPKDSSPEFVQKVEEIINASLYTHLITSDKKKINKQGYFEQRSFEPSVKAIQDNKVQNELGFYVTPTFNQYQGSGGLRIYFNEHLMNIMKPKTQEEIEATETMWDEYERIGIYPIHEERHWQLDKFIRLSTGGERQRYDAGCTEYIPWLLAGKVSKADSQYFTTELGTVKVLPTKILSKTHTGGGTFSATLEIGPVDSDLADLLTVSYPDDPKVTPHELRSFIEYCRNVPKSVIERITNEGKAPILFPIRKITPQIISGVIDANGPTVQRIAIPVDGQMKVFDYKMQEIKHPAELQTKKGPQSI